MPSQSFADRRVVITGGASGIGKGTAIEFARNGAKVCILDLSSSGLDEAKKEIEAEASSGRCSAIQIDVRDGEAIRTAYRSVSEEWGGIDILVCSAGVLRASPLSKMSEADFDFIFGVNVRGVWLAAKEVIPYMTDRPAGTPRRSIVVITSLAALRPKIGNGAYASSKAAATHLVRILGVELAPIGINVNAVAPGMTMTPMVAAAANFKPGEKGGYKLSGAGPVGRVGEPVDVAHAVLFLCSPQAELIVGATLPVDGGVAAAFVPSQNPAN